MLALVSEIIWRPRLQRRRAIVLVVVAPVPPSRDAAPYHLVLNLHRANKAAPSGNLAKTEENRKTFFIFFPGISLSLIYLLLCCALLHLDLPSDNCRWDSASASTSSSPSPPPPPQNSPP